jgi:hypothetical protein
MRREHSQRRFRVGRRLSDPRVTMPNDCLQESWSFLIFGDDSPCMSRSGPRAHFGLRKGSRCGEEVTPSQKLNTAAMKSPQKENADNPSSVKL